MPEVAMRSIASPARLEEFFGQRPRLEYPRLPYKVNLVTVECERESHNVWLKFMPSQGWAELRLVGRPFSIVKLELSDISHMSIRKRDKHPVLVFRFARALTSDLVLSIDPKVMLFWGNQGPGTMSLAESEARYAGDA